MSSDKQKETPSGCRKGKAFKGREGTGKKRNYQQRMCCFPQSHPPKEKGTGLSMNYLQMLTRKFQVKDQKKGEEEEKKCFR